MLYALTLAALACGGPADLEPVVDVVYTYAGTLRVPSPSISPAPGSYTDSVTVSVSNTAAGGTTYCALNANPQRSAAQRYLAPFDVTTSSEVRCQSFTLDGRKKSTIVSAAYTITTGSPPAIAGCASETLRATGTTYYYCECGTGSDASCVAGNNASDGLSPATAKQTGYRAKFDTMAGGSTVALCRGGSFPGTTTQDFNSNCSAGATCDMRDYTPAAHSAWASDQTKRPIIYSNRLLYVHSTTAYSGFRLFNLQSVATNSGQGAILLSGPQSDGDVCNVYFRDSPADLAIQFNQDQGIVTRWTVRESQFHAMNGGVLGSGSYVKLQHNYFSSTAGGPGTDMYHHAVYMSGYASTPGVEITDNEIHGCPVGATVGATMLVAHGLKTDMLVENNYVECDNPAGTPGGFYGISLVTGQYSTAEGFTRPVIRGNRVINAHYYGIAVSQSQDAIIEDNIIVLPPNTGASYGILVGESPADTSGGSDLTSTRSTIRNNTIYISSSTNGAANAGVGVIREGTGHIVTNNAVYYQGSSQSKCFDLPLSSGSYGTLANNACNATWGTTYDTGRVVLSTLPFVSASDFTPHATSPLLNAGTLTSYAPKAPASVAWDPDDAFKNRDASPDIGAMER